MSIDVQSPLSICRRATPLVGVCLVLGLSRMAMAAPPNLGGPGSAGPEEEACAGRAIGDACTLPNRQLGTCGQGTCNRLDYSQGSPPKAIETSCVVCRAADGGSGAATSGTHEDHPTLGSGGAPPDDGSASDAGPSSSSAGEKEPPQSSSRCRVSDGPDAGLLALAALSLLGLLRRRSRA